jgi:hypothetical protein
VGLISGIFHILLFLKGILSEAYTLCATRADFDRALADFMRRHGTRSALVRRLVEAGLWKKVK